MSNVAVANMIAYQNADFSEGFQWTDQNGTPINFTGSTFDMRIALVAGGVATLELVTGTGANSIFSTDLTNGKINIQFADTSIGVGNYVYDLVQITGSARALLMTGTFQVLQGVTQ